MRKLMVLAMVATVLFGLVVAVLPAVCHQGSDGGSGSCDVVTVLRGSVRLAADEVCKAEGAPLQCAVVSTAGLTRK